MFVKYDTVELPEVRSIEQAEPLLKQLPGPNVSAFVIREAAARFDEFEAAIGEVMPQRWERDNGYDFVYYIDDDVDRARAKIAALQLDANPQWTTDGAFHIDVVKDRETVPGISTHFSSEGQHEALLFRARRRLIFNHNLLQADHNTQLEAGMVDNTLVIPVGHHAVLNARDALVFTYSGSFALAHRVRTLQQPRISRARDYDEAEAA